MDTWPVSLQQKLNADSFEKIYGENRVSTDMDVGPAKTRARFTRPVDIFNCEVWLDITEVTTFETFYRTTLGNGTLPFTFTDPLTNATGTFRFAPGSTPSIRPIGNGGTTFKLSMTWERMP